MQPAVVAGLLDDRLLLRAQRLLRAAPGLAQRRPGSAAHRARSADHSEHEWHPDGDAPRRRARRPQPVRPRDGRRHDRRGEPSSPRAAPTARRTGPPPGSCSPPTRTTPPRPSCDWPRAARATPPRRARSSAPATRAWRRSRFRLVRRPRDPRASCCARTHDGPVPAVVYPHGGPTDASGDLWDGHAQYFVDKGYAWLAPNFRGSTGYGREFERANHGVWGVERHQGLPRRRRLPAHAGLGRRRPPGDLRRQLRLLHGARCRSPTTPSTASVRGGQVRRLRHRHLVGAGRPLRRAGPRADDGPPLRRLARPTAPARRSTASTNVRVPLLIAHGERDERVSPEAVRAARRRAAAARRQDLRVRHVPDRGARPPARRAAAGLLSPARALPRLASDVTI